MLSLSNLRKTFGAADAVQDVTFSVEQGEFIAVVGPSGCGKTTLLRMIAGFERPTSGSIHLSGRDITNLSPQSRHIGMVFQNYALFPHMTVRENIAFGLEAHHVSSADIRVRTQQAADRVRLPHKLEASVPLLSGGEQQRVAVARAIVTEPSLLLLDEPLSNLDPVLREEMRSELVRVQKDTGLTTIHVTHDQSEAMAMADRIVVMRSGRIEQIASPREIYFAPANAFVASFMGSAQMFSGRIISRNGTRVVSIVEGLDVEWSDQRQSNFAPDTLVQIAVKPEAVTLAEDGAPAVIRKLTFLGAKMELVLSISNIEIVAHVASSAIGSPSVGSSVHIVIDPLLCSIFPV